MVEAATAIFAAAGHEVNYVLLDDWDAALAAAREGKYSGLIGVGKTEGPDFIFPASDMATSQSSLYVRKDDPWRYAGLESLKDKKVVGINGYAYQDDLDAWLKENGLLVDSLEAATEALLSGKADALVENEYVMSLFAFQNNIVGSVEAAGSLEADSVYVAFSPALPESKEYAEILNKGLQQMKSDGSWKALLEKYGIDAK